MPIEQNTLLIQVNTSAKYTQRLLGYSVICCFLEVKNQLFGIVAKNGAN
jgi:hypothetical protein